MYFQVVLESVKNMGDYDIQELSDFFQVDDRFIIKGRGSVRKKRRVQYRNLFGFDFSFIIFISSDLLRLFISLLVADIEVVENDFEFSDKDMIRDYCFILSYVFGESFDDDDENYGDVFQNYEDISRTIGMDDVCQ